MKLIKITFSVLMASFIFGKNICASNNASQKINLPSFLKYEHPLPSYKERQNPLLNLPTAKKDTSLPIYNFPKLNVPCDPRIRPNCRNETISLDMFLEQPDKNPWRE